MAEPHDEPPEAFDAGPHPDGSQPGSQSAPTQTAPMQEALDLTFKGKTRPVIGLGFANGILKVMSLGLYSFWAKTEVRKRIWSSLRINGEPLTYTGTGRELFFGFLIVFAVIVVPVTALGIVAAILGRQSLAAFQAIIYLGFFLLFGNAVYRATRYRLSRTEWRGIRGALVGSPGSYGWAYFWTLAVPFFLVVAIAGITAYATAPAVGGVIIVAGFVAALFVFPWRANLLQKRITADMRFGSTPLTYDGGSGPLYKRYTFTWLGTVTVLLAAFSATAVQLLTSGIYARLLAKIPPTPRELLPFAGIWLFAIISVAVLTAWYRAHQFNHFARHTHFAGATFRADATGKSLMWLVLSNWLLSIAGIGSGLILGFTAIRMLGIAPQPSVVPNDPDAGGILPSITLVIPIVVMTTAATTLAQFRSARYYLSRLKLDGSVDLNAIRQSDHNAPRRGEGLAQVFDIDAF